MVAKLIGIPLGILLALVITAKVDPNSWVFHLKDKAHAAAVTTQHTGHTSKR